jgi:replicative DNA helicase
MTSVSPDSFSTLDVATGRTPPWSQEAEQAVLGAMLIDQDAALRAVQLLQPEMFYREGHRRLFRAMAALTEARVVIDHVTLREELERRGELEAAGGVDYLAELVDAVPSTANLDFHAAIVRDKSILRRLIETATAIIGEAYAARHPAGELLDSAEARVFHISQQRREDGFERLKEMLWPTMERIEALHKSGRRITGVPSGFVDLDEMTSGFQRSELIIVAARPSMGKTSLCLNVAVHAALEGVGVAVFSLEMSREAVVQRMLCSEARVDSQLVRRGTLRDHDFTKLARAAGILQGAPLWIDDTPAQTLLEVRSKARRLKAENDLGLIIVDYLQLMRSPEYADNRVQEISDISRSLKALARELDLPVIALSQLSRASEQRGGDRKPILSDLRDSGAIEQDADVVIFIHRPEMYQREDSEGRSLEGLAEIIVAKHRNGPTGRLELHFEKSLTRFGNLTEREGPSCGGADPFGVPVRGLRAGTPEMGGPLRGVRGVEHGGRGAGRPAGNPAVGWERRSPWP